jgi:hypothetical protein
MKPEKSNYNSYKELNIFLLTSLRESPISYYVEGGNIKPNWMFYSSDTYEFKNTEHHQTHHIYVTSNEKIVAGDWYVNNQKKSRPYLNKCTGNKIFDGMHYNCFKVVATTDVEINVDFINENETNKKTLPNIPDNFILSFIEMMNLGFKFKTIHVMHFCDYGKLNSETKLLIDEENNILVKDLQNEFSLNNVVDIINDLVMLINIENINKIDINGTLISEFNSSKFNGSFDKLICKELK